MSRLAVSLVLVAACAAPQESYNTMPPGETSPRTEGGEDEPVCREEAVTGSTLKRTVCRTPSEMARDRDNARDFHERAGRAPPPPRL